MAEIYIGDIVRLSQEYGNLLGTLEKVNDDNGIYTAIVQLSGAASIEVSPEALTYAGPPIPPEPEVGAMVLVADVPYRRDDKGWRQMGRRHGHATPKRLVAVDLDAERP